MVGEGKRHYRSCVRDLHGARRRGNGHRGGMAVANQVAATEASANAARAIARGENRSEVEQHLASAVKNSTITVATTPGAGGQPGFVKVTVTVKNPLKDAESTSVAVNEENIGSSGDAG